MKWEAAMEELRKTLGGEMKDRLRREPRNFGEHDGGALEKAR